MLFNIPQFIDKEDKIVGPFTAKQLGWMASAAVVMFLSWTVLDFSAFIIASIPIAGIFGALAFYRPNNQPLIYFILSSVAFAFKPKMYIWRRIPEKIVTIKEKKDKNAITAQKKEISIKKISEIAKLLDNKQ